MYPVSSEVRSRPWLKRPNAASARPTYRRARAVKGELGGHSVSTRNSYDYGFATLVRSRTAERGEVETRARSPPDTLLDIDDALKNSRPDNYGIPSRAANDIAEARPSDARGALCMSCASKRR